ncbi:MAG: hypothetical protein K2L14_04320 [Duncaniella sp.]|nr:hypothetical protein [Duncaniella sp.]
MDKDNKYLESDRRLGIIFQYVVLVCMSLYYSYRAREIKSAIDGGFAILSAIGLILIYVLVNHIFVSKVVSHKRLLWHEVILVLTLYALMLGAGI